VDVVVHHVKRMNLLGSFICAYARKEFGLLVHLRETVAHNYLRI